MIKKLFLLDGMALAYRAHFALSKNPRLTAAGINTSAMMGFTNTLLEVLNKEKPSHIAVVFDTAAPTQRHETFAGYKAGRQIMPEDLSIALPYIREIISGFNIPVITQDGYEADDIIGTLAVQAAKQGFITYMMTPDKDFAQLVSDQIFIYKPARNGNGAEILGVPEVLAKWEIKRVEQVIDLLGLWGDAVDNIPGIPGIGEKTAKILIAKYDSIENLIAHAHELKGKQKENVIGFAQQGILSKKLATILLDVPIVLDPESLAIQTANKEVLEPLFAKLEFRTLGKRIFGDDFSVKAGKASQNGQLNLFAQTDDSPNLPIESEASQSANLHTAANTSHVYLLCDTPEKRTELIEQLATQTAFCFDTETTSVNAHQAELVGLSFCYEKSKAYYVPLPKNRAEVLRILAEFEPLLTNSKIQKIGQNLKYDILVLKWYGLQVQGSLFDTMLAHYLIDADARHNMDYLAQSYLNYQPIPITDLIGKKGKNQANMRDVEINIAAEYAAEDADITLQLKNIFEPMLPALGAQSLFTDLENPLIYVLADMEKAGVGIDIVALATYSKELAVDIAALEQNIYSKAGITFNIASPKQLGEVLFDKLQLDPKAKKTKTGQYQTGEEVLSYLAPKHEIIADILSFRSLQKLKSTYVDALPLMQHPATGRIHTSFNQAIAATGRLSSNNPNLQNIPIRTEKGREVRKAFVARSKDHVLLSADYSQIELRILAEMSRDEGLLAAFRAGQDIHTATAAKVYSVPTEQVSAEQRRHAKSVNFGIIYGQSAFGLSNNLGISRKEAAQIIATYFEQYPSIQKYMDNTIAFAKANGYVQTLLGRRRYLRDINSGNATVRGFAERNAINAPIQGSAADLIKIAMINIHQQLSEQKLDTRLILQVHDELVFDVPCIEIPVVKPLIKHLMQSALPMQVPILVECGTGANWLLAH